VNALMSSKIRYANNKYMDARRNLREVLRLAYPIGSCVQVRLSHKQKTLSRATVIDIDLDPGHLRVKLDNAKEFSRTPARSIHFTNVHNLLE
jgi:hypothetical protein